MPGFREFAVFEKIKRFFILFFWMGVTERGQGPKYLSIVYKVLSIYKVLPGFREFAVFDNKKKTNRFFYTFLDGRYKEGVRALARAQIYIYISIGIYIVVYKVLSIYKKS